MGQQRFESLDAMRGLAALSVVLWHWQHLSLLAGTHYIWTQSTSPAHSVEPFYFIFKPFYDRGAEAVNLFFVISGFVFFYLYRDTIRTRQIAPSNFFLLRFSRLYPLHILTLSLTALLVIKFHALTGSAFVFQHNDLNHFLENVMFVNVLDPLSSFNGPSWSLTVEILMYFLFYALAFWGLLQGFLGCAALALIGLFLIRIAPYPMEHAIGQGLAGFFLGGFTQQAFAKFHTASISEKTRAKIIAGATALMMFGWVATLFFSALGTDKIQLGDHSIHLRALPTLLVYGLFPLTVFVLATLELRRTKDNKFFLWLGSISYSSYLLHFPMQLILALLVVQRLLPVSVWTSPVVFSVYFALLLLFATLSLRIFEAPAQNLIRQWFAPAAETQIN